MQEIILLTINILSRHERESTRVHSTNSLTYLLAFLTSKLCLNLKVLLGKRVDNWRWTWFDKISSWWTENRWQTKSWWIKVPFSFANDGWKLWDWLHEYSAYVLISMLLISIFNLPALVFGVNLAYIYGLVLIFISGGYHSFMDKSLLREILKKK